jgi:hypothetical protein
MALARLTGPMVVMLISVWTINRAPMTQEVVVVSWNPSAPVTMRHTNMPINPAMYSVARPNRVIKNQHRRPVVEYGLRDAVMSVRCTVTHNRIYTSSS